MNSHDNSPVLYSHILENNCAYINGNKSSTLYNVIHDASPQQAESYLNGGWRRFGSMFFRPQCSGCQKCIPLRVKVSDFKISKSMRKVLKKNEHITVQHRKPQTTFAGLHLHNLYHQHQHQLKGWDAHQVDAGEYNMLFGEASSFGEEHRYFDGEKLVGISYVDRLPNTLSAVYFFYHPEWAALSPGTFSVLHEIEYARQVGIEHYHLGYYVPSCPSMQYKKRFGPHEFLKGEGELWDWEDSTWEKEL